MTSVKLLFLFMGGLPRPRGGARRGGSWNYPASGCRIGERYAGRGNDRWNTVGFRVVCEVKKEAGDPAGDPWRKLFNGANLVGWKASEAGFFSMNWTLRH